LQAEHVLLQFQQVYDEGLLQRLSAARDGYSGPCVMEAVHEGQQHPAPLEWWPLVEVSLEEAAQHRCRLQLRLWQPWRVVHTSLEEVG